MLLRFKDFKEDPFNSVPLSLSLEIHKLYFAPNEEIKSHPIFY